MSTLAVYVGTLAAAFATLDNEHNNAFSFYSNLVNKVVCQHYAAHPQLALELNNGTDLSTVFQQLPQERLSKPMAGGCRAWGGALGLSTAD